MDEEIKYHYFLEERSKVLGDIEEFLRMILRYLIRTNMAAPLPTTVSRNVRLVIKSLYVLHGLYGFPRLDSTKDLITGNKTRYNQNSILEAKIGPSVLRGEAHGLSNVSPNGLLLWRLFLGEMRNISFVALSCEHLGLV